MKLDWNREDFIISNDNCKDNVYLFMMEFIRHLHLDHGFDWVTGDLFCELLFEYFGGVGKKREGFFFTFSEEKLDEYLGRFFSLFLLRDAKGMAVLKAIEYFSVFLHQRGIYTDRELGEVERVVAEFEKPLREIYEINPWRYRFVEGLG